MAKFGISSPKHKGRFDEVEADNPFKAVEQYLIDNYIPYDADNAGWASDHFVVVSDQHETFYRCEYSWWIDYDPEWDLKSEYEIYRIEKDECPRILGKRDWLWV